MLHCLIRDVNHGFTDSVNLYLTIHSRVSIIDSMNRMDTAHRPNVIRCLIEGNSINSTVRMTSTAKNAVLKLLVEIGSACSEFRST
jgi:hypothetical protein